MRSVLLTATVSDSDSWVSSAVRFALVKSVTPRHQIELQAVGDGAKSSITETPKEMRGLGRSLP